MGWWKHSKTRKIHVSRNVSAWPATKHACFAVGDRDERCDAGGGGADGQVPRARRLHPKRRHRPVRRKRRHRQATLVRQGHILSILKFHPSLFRGASFCNWTECNLHHLLGFHVFTRLPFWQIWTRVHCKSNPNSAAKSNKHVFTWCHLFQFVCRCFFFFFQFNNRTVQWRTFYIARWALLFRDTLCDVQDFQ